ncbi:MAG: hypothetical protein ACLUQC_11075 [Lactococcus raffinolactis]
MREHLYPTPMSILVRNILSLGLPLGGAVDALVLSCLSTGMDMGVYNPYSHHGIKPNL